MKKLLFQPTRITYQTFTKRFFQTTPKLFNIEKQTEFSIENTHYSTLGITDVHSSKQEITAKFRKVRKEKNFFIKMIKKVGNEISS